MLATFWFDSLSVLYKNAEALWYCRLENGTTLLVGCINEVSALCRTTDIFVNEAGIPCAENSTRR
jgi:hypothetical protein